jgi:hypothetical protein
LSERPVSRMARGTLVTLVLLMGRGVYADEDPSTLVRISMTNGALIHGTLTASQIVLSADGRHYTVPIEQLKHLTPGLSRRPELLEEIQALVRDLGSEDFHKRESVSRQLRDLGPVIKSELELFQQDSDAERQYRVGELLQLIDKHRTPTVWSRKDRIEFGDQTLSGTIAADLFEVVTKYGRLRVPLSEISILRQSDGRGRVDLLKLIDPRRQSIRGDWKLKDGILVSPPDVPWALLQLDMKPPPTYTIRATVERKEGHDALIFPIIVGDKECNVCIDGWPRDGKHHSGLEMIRGLGPPSNETRHWGDLLTPDKLASIQIDVTATSVRLTVDRRQIFDWRGSPDVFSMQKGWERPDKTVLGLGSYSASFHISRLELRATVDQHLIVRAAVDDCILELKDGTRLIVKPTEDQRITIKSRSVSNPIPLTQLRSLTQAEDNLAEMRAELVGNKAIVGEIEPQVLKFEARLGVLKLPTRDIVRITRPKTANGASPNSQR